MNRKHVHLSASTHFATIAGERRGELVLLEVDTEKAMENKLEFYHAGGEVWLSGNIPIEFVKESEKSLEK